MKTINTFLVLMLASTIMHAQELHTQSNSVSITNESNSTSGWGGNLNVTSVSTESYSGNYSIKFEAQSDGWRLGTYDLDLVIGDQYEISIYAKKSAGTTSASITNWDGFDFNGNHLAITSTDWQEYRFNVTADETTGRIKVYVGTPAITGNTVYIDHVSIRNLSNATGDTQAPTAPNLTNTGQTDVSANLSWSGATDNVGVTGYKVYKDNILETTLGNVSSHQVTGLSASATYQFKVRALDAAGNESSDSNIVSVTTDASSGNGGSSGSGPVWSEDNSVASYSGNVAVGRSTVPSGYQMAVEGKIRTREVRVDQDNWPDYVFEEDYDLPSLEEIHKYITEKGHLPNIPSAKEIEANGLELGEMNSLLLEKIEEITLHTIRQEKEIERLKMQIRAISLKTN